MARLLPFVSLPAPYSGADDASLVEGCLADDEDAWRVLFERHGSLLSCVVVRALDERAPARLSERHLVLKGVEQLLRRNQGGPLRTWDRNGSLACYLSVLARQVASSHIADVTPPSTLLAGMPTPGPLRLEDIAIVEPARKVSDTVDRLEPHLTAMVRLRLRGLTAAGVAGALGMPQPTVVQSLSRVARRLSQLDGDRATLTLLAWRQILDCAPIEERVSTALRTEDEEIFAGLRSRSEAMWRAVRDAIQRVEPADTSCLDDRAVASFIDGSMRGADRSRAEGHLTTCGRCIDIVARVTLDLRARDVLRHAGKLPGEVLLAAACVATERFRAARQIVAPLSQQGAERARDIERLATVGLCLEGGNKTDKPELSGVVSTALPADHEAPLVAMEACIASDLREAARAIDDHTAKAALGGRLRLLAEAAGHDVEAARKRAQEVLERPRADPGLELDAEAVAALPPGRILPREMLLERLRAALPEVVRFVLSR